MLFQCRRSFQIAFAVMVFSVLCTPTFAQNATVHLISDRTCAAEGGSQWEVTNFTNQSITVILNKYYENDGVSSREDVPLTLLPREKRTLGCSNWSRGHVGRQTFSMKDEGSHPQSHNPSPAPPPPSAPVPAPLPFPQNDATFKYLGRKGFSRPAGGTADTVVYSWPVVLDPGMEIDESYQQANETRGWKFVPAIGGATTPMTVDQIPHGILLKTTGENYLSVRAPQIDVDTKLGALEHVLANVALRTFKLTLYCGPPAHQPCSVFVDVWVKERPAVSAPK